MKKAIAVFGMVALFAIVSSLSFAGEPTGLEEKGKVPTGFNQGEKSGWENEYPPGWEHRSEQEKQQWEDAVKNGKKRIAEDAKKKGMSKQEAESAADDFEKAARKGTDVKEGESIVKDNIKKGKKGKELSYSVAEESEKRLKGKDKQMKEKGKRSGKGKKK
jgi:hypothetical protein